MSITRTEQDILNRKRARLKWIQSEHGKKWSQNYMKDYRRLPHTKEKAREYYIKNKAHWGEITKNKKRNGVVCAKKMKILEDFMKSGHEKTDIETMIFYMQPMQKD